MGTDRDDREGTAQPESVYHRRHLAPFMRGWTHVTPESQMMTTIRLRLMLPVLIGLIIMRTAQAQPRSELAPVWWTG